MSPPSWHPRIGLGLPYQGYLRFHGNHRPLRRPVEPEYGDFVFRADPDARLYIVDPRTEAPLRAGRGLLKGHRPELDARPAAANVSVLQYDEAEIVTSREDGRVEPSRRFARFQAGAQRRGLRVQGAEIAGCEAAMKNDASFLTILTSSAPRPIHFGDLEIQFPDSSPRAPRPHRRRAGQGPKTCSRPRPWKRSGTP